MYCRCDTRPKVQSTPCGTNSLFNSIWPTETNLLTVTLPRRVSRIVCILNEMLIYIYIINISFISCIYIYLKVWKYFFSPPAVQTGSYCLGWELVQKKVYSELKTWRWSFENLVHQFSLFGSSTNCRKFCPSPHHYNQIIWASSLSVVPSYVENNERFE